MEDDGRKSDSREIGEWEHTFRETNAYEVSLEEPRPHQSRRKHQELLRKRQRRRQARARRLRAIMGLQFWSRASIVIVVLVCMVFWAKFALIYDIPETVQVGNQSDISAYVTVKPWWFGPPVFDIGQTEASWQRPYLSPEDSLLQGLGRYAAVVLHPEYVWILKR